MTKESAIARLTEIYSATYSGPAEHRDAAIRRFSERASRKYDMGQEEHGGRFWRKPVLRYMQDEIVDLVFYYDVLAGQQERAIQLLEWATSSPLPHPDPEGISPYRMAKMALNVLKYGNEDGATEEEHNGPKE